MFEILLCTYVVSSLICACPFVVLLVAKIIGMGVYPKDLISTTVVALAGLVPILGTFMALDVLKLTYKLFYRG